MKVQRGIRNVGSVARPHARFSTASTAAAGRKTHMLRLAPAIAILVILAMSSNPGLQSRAYAMNPRAALGSTKDRLRAEAAEVEKAEVSPLFAALPRLAGDPTFRLREEQIQHCRKLEALARDVVRAWLLRGLDRESLPEASEMEDRLSGPGTKLREAIFAHFEAMAFQGILTPEQLHLWLKTSGAKPRRPLHGRLELPTEEVPPDSKTSDELAFTLKAYVMNLNRSGQVFDAILGSYWVDSEFPKGLDEVALAKMAPELKANYEPADLPRAALEPDQYLLARRLDDLTKKIAVAWVIRGLDDKPAPSRPDLVDRFTRRLAVVDVLDAHAEAIALEGILKPDQADRCLAVVWSRMGVQSLLDPSLSTRLRLTRAQQEQIKSMIAEKESGIIEMRKFYTVMTRDRLENPGTAEENSAKIKQFDQEAQRQMEASDAAILAVLKPWQSRRLKQVMSSIVAPKAKREVMK